MATSKMRKLKREFEWWWYKQLCHRKSIPVTEMFYQIDLIKPNGKIVDRVEGMAESYVRNFYNFLAQNMLGIQPSTYSMGAYGDGSLTIKSTAGTDYTGQGRYIYGGGSPIYQNIESIGSTIAGVRAGATVGDFGIIFDNSDTAYTFEQTAPVSAIANGTGVGQLVYGDTFLPYMTYDAPDDKWTCIWERMALNNEAATQVSVDVKSISLVSRAQYGATASILAMLARDVLVSTITVPYSFQIKGRWTLTHDR